jgi:hypothetical protein
MSSPSNHTLLFRKIRKLTPVFSAAAGLDKRKINAMTKLRLVPLLITLPDLLILIPPF